MTTAYILAGLMVLEFILALGLLRRHRRLLADYDRLELRVLMLGCAIEDAPDTPAQIRESSGSFTVYRTCGDFDLPVKTFTFTRTQGDKAYARNCAEELADKLNERP